MTTMYQSVDDPEELEETSAQDRARARRSLWIWLALAVAVLAVIAVFSGNRNTGSSETDVSTRAERASYRTAISERNVDLRRARLRDFEITYSKSEFLRAARAQLEVLDAHETKAWAVLTDAMFDPAGDRITKLAAIQAYEKNWGASYLGGRDEDIRQLREELEIDPEPVPSRELTGVKSPIPTNVPDRVMVGGPQTAPSPRPAPVRPYVPPVVETVSQAEIIAAKVRRNVTPRYPRKAARRKINAVVELSLSVDDEGKVQMSEVVSVTAERYAKDFVKAATRAAKRTRYTPKTVDGKPVPTNGVTKRYVFRMD